MKKNLTEVIMNPVRQRILQYLLVHHTGTAGEMRTELCDVPPASLYRHIKIMLEAECIEIAEENKVRGTVEKVYRIAKSPVQPDNNEDINALFMSGLLSLMATFQKYFANPQNNPQKDLLSLSTSTLMMSDEEYIQFLTKLGELVGTAISNKPAPNRKPRRLTFVSSPCENDEITANKEK